MSAPDATSGSSSPSEKYPLVRYAAVCGVQYATTDERHPEAVWKKGGVMLTEVVPGEYVIIVVGGAYNVTVDRCIMAANMEICPDTRSREVRWSLGYQNGHTKSWTYLRFGVPTAMTKFTRELFAAFDEVSAKHHLIHSRIWDIAYEEPSNFTNYCREYLGQDYFDHLEDSDSDMDELDEDDVDELGNDEAAYKER